MSSRVPDHWPAEIQHSLDVCSRRHGARIDLPKLPLAPPTARQLEGVAEQEQHRLDAEHGSGKFVASTGPEKTRGRPRNRIAFEQSQITRSKIRALLEKHPPTAEPLTAKEIKRRLGLHLQVRTIQWHVVSIRTEDRL